MVRLANIEHDGQIKFVAQVVNKENKEKGPQQYYVDLTNTVASNIKEFFLLGKEAGLERVQKELSSSENIIIDDDTVRLLAPMDGSLCGKFLCIGMNYKDHCTEQNIPIPTEPLVFTKFGDCIIGPDEPLVKDDHTDQLDYEVELGVVIGKTVPRFLSEEDDDIQQYIGGYTVIHDVSARDWQLGGKNGGQWILGKAMDGYAPMGPVIVTPDELPEAESTGLRCRVNGETLQDSNTNQLIFKIPELLVWISKFITLRPGDVIATGTPPGVGCFRKPTPRWLVPGDVVECEIDGIGTLTNPVVSASERRPPPAVLPSSCSSSGPLKGRACIVTGGVRGIGYGIAKRLGEDGARRVALVDVVSNDVGAEAVAKLQQENTNNCVTYTYEQCDVTKYEKVEACWKRIAANGGKIDILVQAAGIVGDTNIKTEDVNPQNFQDVLNVNVHGIFHGCKAVLPYMKAGNFGRIVNISSIAGKEGNAGMLAYSTSKAAVIGLTKTLGKEYATSGDITCNAICPAVVRTEMVAAMPPAQVTYMTDKIPMKRCGTIEEIAAMVAFMVSPEASFTTGFCFDATGGRSVY